MPEISRRTALARRRQAVAAEGDAELLDLEAQLLRLVDEQNAGLCNNAQGDVSEEVVKREERLEAAIIRTAARTPQGIAVKLRRARYWLGEVLCEDTGLVESAIADLARMGRARSTA